MARAQRIELDDKIELRLPSQTRRKLEEAVFAERRKPSALARIFIEDGLAARYESATVEAGAGR